MILSRSSAIFFGITLYAIVSYFFMPVIAEKYLTYYSDIMKVHESTIPLNKTKNFHLYILWVYMGTAVVNFIPRISDFKIVLNSFCLAFQLVMSGIWAESIFSPHI